MRRWCVVAALGMWMAVSLLAMGRMPVAAAPARQATLAGPQVQITEDVNVRAGPGTDYDLIGRMVPGQTEAILGKVTVGSFVWLKVVYFGGPANTGWVLAGLVSVVGDLNAVPEAEVPPTPTRPPTATLAVAPAETASSATAATPGPDANRLPTFTPPALVVRPTLLPVQGVSSGSGGFPPALAIIILFVLGVFAGVVSLVRSRG